MGRSSGDAPRPSRLEAREPGGGDGSQDAEAEMNGSDAVNAGELIERLAKELPEDLRAHLFLVGSLAAAYHHLDDRMVKTKDADLVVHPARDVLSAAQIAER